MVSDNRRQFLRIAATSAGVAGANLLPPVIQKAMAIPATRETGTIQDVKHIVILMQENRSFDHYFGSLKGVRGFGDPRPARLPNGQPVWNQPNGAGTLLPFHPTAPDLGLAFLAGTPHDWTTTHQAWNSGNYDQWVAAKGTNTMAYYTRNDIPFHYALADAFTVCDAYHCALLGPTDPNRYHMWTGWVGNDGSGGGPVVDNAEAGYGWSTYPELLQSAGVSWKVYQDVGLGLNAANSWGWTSNPYIGNYGDNSLLYFFQYQNAQPGNPLFDNAVTGTNVNADPTQTFFDILAADVKNGTLPQVSWIVAPEAYSEHPNWAPNYGAWYVEQVLAILTSNEALWGQTALFVTYDENDGFFDHVVPPTAPASRAQGLSTVATTNDIFPGNSSYPSGPYGLGNRVPMMVVSPWTRGGWVCSQVFDHTSLIRFMEKRFGLGHPGLVEANITPWRRAVCGDLTSAFNFDNPNATLPTLPSTVGYLPPTTNRYPNYNPVPPTTQVMPVQEPGLKWSRPLPYEINARGALDASTGSLALSFVNTGKQASVFLVTETGGVMPRSYTVEAGKQLHDTWPLAAQGAYDLLVQGPDAFHRRFAGNAAVGRTVAPEVTSAYDLTDGPALTLTLTNGGVSPITITVTPNAYTRSPARAFKLAAGASVSDRWALKESVGWYDLSVTCDASATFLRRLAGRVETGKPGVSDPATRTTG